MTYFKSHLDVVIVGAGIGGLQAALALAADGHQVTVLESVEKFLEVSKQHLGNCGVNDDSVYRLVLASESRPIRHD